MTETVNKIVDNALDIILDTVIDTAKLIPFLFLTYLLMEYIEHKTSEKTGAAVAKAGKFGPVFGGLLGIIPQCGFSASAAGLYSGRLISAGTLTAIFLSTSDEMLPIFISEHDKISTKSIIEILAIKVVAAIIFGFAVDAVMNIRHKGSKKLEIQSICQNEHCHCEEGSIFKSALIHSGQIVAFIFIISLILNTVVTVVGEDNLGKLFVNIPFAGCLISSLIGLIPNCAASVVITELYLSGVISAGALISGLLTGCGIGLLVLFRTNRNNLKENISILSLMYFFGVAAGFMVELTKIEI